MAQITSTKSTTSVATQTDVTNCKCQVNTTQIQHSNSSNYNKETVKQVSVQTETKTIEIENTESESSASQPSQEVWHTVVGRSRPHSLSPRGRGDARGSAQRGKAGEPPDKQLRASQSPVKSGNHNKSTVANKPKGAAVKSDQVKLNSPRKKIDYP